MKHGRYGMARSFLSRTKIHGVNKKKCPKKGCYKNDGHAPKTHGTQADVMAERQARRNRPTVSYQRSVSPKASPANREGRRESVALRQLGRMDPGERARAQAALAKAAKKAS